MCRKQRKNRLLCARNYGKVLRLVEKIYLSFLVLVRLFCFELALRNAIPEVNDARIRGKCYAKIHFVLVNLLLFCFSSYFSYSAELSVMVWFALLSFDKIWYRHFFQKICNFDSVVFEYSSSSKVRKKIIHCHYFISNFHWNILNFTMV